MQLQEPTSCARKIGMTMGLMSGSYRVVEAALAIEIRGYELDLA
jgi:hypothetical protein